MGRPVWGAFFLYPRPYPSGDHTRPRVCWSAPPPTSSFFPFQIRSVGLRLRFRQKVLHLIHHHAVIKPRHHIRLRCFRHLTP